MRRDKQVQIGSIERRGHVLTRPALKCLNQVAAINPTLGCIHQCAYCYVRGYTMYPGDGKVFIYDAIVEKLRRELSKRRKLPLYVFFSPTCDVLQPIPQVLKVTYDLMRVLFEHGIGVNLLTKGKIPVNFLPLFQRYKKLVHVQIGITTLCRDIQRRLEPYASTPAERVRNIERLCAIDVVPEIKLDPLIPDVTDTEQNITTLFKALQKYGIRSTGMNYLFLRPQIKKNIGKAFRNTPLLANNILRHYEKGKSINLLAAQSHVFALDMQYRKQAYTYIAECAKASGIYAYVCGCKNPDITEEPLCATTWGQYFEEKFTQKRLFSPKTGTNRSIEL
ncbi:MAG: hypothetical protein E3K32_13125 [wastewater metagenome]|nr:hypothetical protein [Candidatus Loosdrechtia aerotolerans]